MSRYIVTNETLSKCYKPFDIVSYDGCFGIIVKVDVNDSQPEPNQISYYIEWFFNDKDLHVAWWKNDNKFKYHGNIMIILAKSIIGSDPFGKEIWVEKLFKNL